MGNDKIPVIINGRASVDTKNKKHINQTQKGSAQNDQQRKVVIIGDSHARGYAANMK
jgi:hypothetical protein